MKHKIQKMILLSMGLVIFCVSFAGASSYSDAVLADNPASYFSFDNSYDYTTHVWGATSGYGWVAGSGAMTSGISGNAIDIATGGRCVADIHATSSFTQEIWLKSNSSSYEGAPLTINPGQASAGAMIGRGDSGNLLNVFVGWGSNYIGTLTVADPSIWHQVVVTVSESACKVYLDGQEQITNVGFTAAAYGDFYQQLGGFPDQYVAQYGANIFQGALDEYSVYDYALSADRILAHYNSVDWCATVNASYMLSADLNKDCYVDFKDFAQLAEDWMQGFENQQPVTRTITWNADIIAPQISAPTIDGNLSDWAEASSWAVFGKWWNSYGAVPYLTSTSRAQYAWNDAGDMLYIGIESTQGQSLVLEVGGLMGNLTNPSAKPQDGLQATQIQLEPTGSAGEVIITNQIPYTMSEGVVAKYSWNGTTMTIEIAVPIYANWQKNTTRMILSSGMDIYMYANVGNAINGGTAADSQIINGQYIQINVSPTMVVGSKVTLVP